MSNKTIALDFTDIALDEIQNENIESAKEFITDAAELLAGDEDYEESHENLQEAVELLEEDRPEAAYDCVRLVWVTLAD